MSRETIKNAIETLGISQNHACRLLGMSARDLRGWLSNDNPPAWVALAFEGLVAKVEAVRYSVTTDMVADYLTADFGCYLAVYADGTYDVRASGECYMHDTAIAVAKCPGIGNLDSSDFTDGFVTRDEDTGEYIVTGEFQPEQGRVVGDLDAVIRECCREGDVTDYVESLRDALVESYLDGVAGNSACGD